VAIWHVLVGPPLRARDVSREQNTPVEGPSALSLDALTFIAYGPEAILAVLAGAGVGALHLVLPITAAIVALLAILVFSYRQVIDAYPGGGGAYSVSRQLRGAGQPARRGGARRRLHPLRRGLHRRGDGGADLGLSAPCSGDAADLPRHPRHHHAAHLRGQGDAARAFLLPTTVFIVGLLAIIAIGLVHPLASRPGRPAGRPRPPTHWRR
jgi:hypothetical protein